MTAAPALASSPPAPLLHQRPAIEPGLLILHGNRLELLGAAVFEWLRREPLAPLEEELILVPSNGMAEWVKMELATAHGACAATRVELPARFVWRAYRAVLGRGAVPPRSALDKLPLTWRLMRLLPQLAANPVFAPVAGFLGAGDDGTRRLQLAQRLADLFDQYQVYRADWLQAWEDGDDRLPRAGGAAAPVPDHQQWQPALWRALQAELTSDERAATRPQLHQRFVQALAAGRPARGLPRRVVLFGTTHVPQPTLQAITALATRCQVLMAVPNPCRFHWADTIAGRELLRLQQRRQPLRGGRDLAAVPLQDMHAHGHPLLSAWGRQARDFVRQLDAWEDSSALRQQLGTPRVDLFDEQPAGQGTLLQQVQAGVRDLLPAAEQPRSTLVDTDHSIVFHIAHSAQREVEVLHDQLLQLLADTATPPLQPRDIVVMVPDIEAFAPAIRSVFGACPRGDARHIPWGITDQRERGQQPLLVALEWLLRAPSPRVSLSELQSLLDVPAVARRLGVDSADLPLLAAWMQGAGIRWGLHGAHRAQLGLAACGDGNTAQFGLQRMLLGYASGQAGAFAGIEPFDEVAGLSAALAGALAQLLQTLDGWWHGATQPRTPVAWAMQARALLAAVFEAGDDVERALLAALDTALADWLDACAQAGFEQPVALDVLREAWLQGLDEAAAGGRFKAGGVTFCTLLPLRSIPFEVVCLLGMNDGDYPRRGLRADFDLMALPGQARPGDRLRRDDDRQLMLDALTAARRVLYISWAGRSPRDNSALPPSVLVGQLRDHLANVWGQAAVAARTVEHPLQPFSRRYFEPGSQLFTHAGEWRRAHVPDLAAAATAVPAAARAGGELTVATLARFLANPVKAFFQHRLQVVFDDQALAALDDELFGADAGLDRWQLDDELLRQAAPQVQAGAVPHTVLADEAARLARAGRLPLGAPGRRLQAQLQQRLVPVLQHWQQQLQALPQPWPQLRLHATLDQPAPVQLLDWLAGLRVAPQGTLPTWVDLQAGAVGTGRQPKPRPDKVLAGWVRAISAAAAGQPLAGVLIGSDGWLLLAPPSADDAQVALQALLRAWAQSVLVADAAPLPTALRTGLAWLADADSAAEAYDGNGFNTEGERRDACLARCFPDFEALSAAPGFDDWTRALYQPLQQWIDQHVVWQPHPPAP